MQNILRFNRTNCVEIPILLAFISCIPFLLTSNTPKQPEWKRYDNINYRAISAASSNGVVKIGNPGLKQFPDDNVEDRFARSVWDMYRYDDRVYVGVGDFWRNRGPIDVWSFDAAGSFRKEYTVAEEQVHLFREYDGKLFIPGMDATKYNDGNLYINDGDVWQKLGTIPHALHVYDVAFFEESIYVTVSGNGYSEILKSSNMGQSWESLWKYSDTGFREIIALDDSLLIMGTAFDRQPCLYRYIDWNLETLDIAPFPNMNRGVLHSRIVRFRSGVLYIGDYSPLCLKSSSSLIFLGDFDAGIVVIEKFQKRSVRDIVVRGGTCYILTASKSGGALQGCIHSSSDLETWIKLVEFTVPAMPYSLELLEGSFYVALGYSVESQSVESGSIYRVDLDVSDIELPAWDVDRNGAINLLDLMLVGQHFGEVVTTLLDPDPDVNGDGSVDILDVVLVGKRFGEMYLP